MAGFQIQLPRRLLMDEYITTGTTQKTGVTGWTGQGAAARVNSWAGPFRPASSSAYVMNIQAATSSAALTITTYSSSGLPNSPFNQPDFPRAVTICPTTSLLATGNVVVNGTDQFGATVADTIALGGTGAPLITGVQPFKTITSVVL